MAETVERARWDRMLSLVGRRGRVWVKTQPLGVVGGIILLAAIFMAAFAPFLVGDPYFMNFDDRLEAPSLAYLLGTDGFGRDVLARVVFGARVEIIVSFTAVLMGAGSGAVVGLISGYFGGLVDEAIQRIVDALMALPMLILALGIVAVMGPSLWSVIIAISVPFSARAARIIRATALGTKNTDFVTAARAIGATNTRILIVHLAPQAIAPFLVIATVWLSGAILAEAALSYLGFGPAPPFVSWGGMLSVEAAPHFRQAPWTAIVPGVAITLLVYGVNMLGDTVRDVTDPRLRGVRSPVVQ